MSSPSHRPQPNTSLTSTAACATVRTILSGALTSPDETWDISANVGWRLPEVNIGIVCANAPALRPLYLYMRGRLDTKTRGQSVAVSDIAGTRTGAAGGGGADGAMGMQSPKKSVASLGSGSGREKLVGTYAQFEERSRRSLEDEERGFTPPGSPGVRWH